MATQELKREKGGSLIKEIKREVRPIIINRVDTVIDYIIKEVMEEYIDSFFAMLLSQDKFRELWDNKEDSVWDNVSQMMKILRSHRTT